jgi:hypothetical protein
MDLDVIADKALDGASPRAHAQRHAYALLDDHLAFRSDNVRHV